MAVLRGGAWAAQPNFAYLDESDPYYVSGTFPKLTTPQWIGEPGVDAAVILSIDDMRDPAKYEVYLRPILDRLKQIEGRAALSIMACSVSPDDPRLRQWMTEGVHIGVHTVAHPCPLLAKNNFDFAKSTVDDCTELINAIPGNRAVAFRVPCCDSLNTPSPRFFAEIFNGTTRTGQFLTIDSSVFNITTANDPELRRRLAVDSDGRERFRKYLPFPSFVNTIEDYPYPYIIGRLCWEFPCTVPSDWEAQHLHGVNDPRSVEDMKAAIDAAVLKRGVYVLVFHPHGWIRNDQIVELIDHAVANYGARIKFLNFREAEERLNRHLLAGHPLRNERGRDNGVRLLDLNGDGHLDVVIGNNHLKRTRVWSPEAETWIETAFPALLATAEPENRGADTGVRFAGRLGREGEPGFVFRDGSGEGAWVWDNGKWTATPKLLEGIEINGSPVVTAENGIDRGARFRDVDHDGAPELIVGNERTNAVFVRRRPGAPWRPAPFGLPARARVVDDKGRDAGLRFFDLDHDGDDDVIYSNEIEYGVYLFDSMETGWATVAVEGTRGGGTGLAVEIPPIAVDGRNNGAWFHSRHLWIQNETTDTLPDLVDRRSLAELLQSVEPEPLSPEASLAALRVRPGLRVELAAAEPLVVDPVAIAWDPDGRLWVVEMRDYPLGMDGNGKPGSRVKYLEDTDGDGRYDKGTVFVDKLPYATGVMPWRNGVLITAAPQILFAEDRNGSGRADRVAPLFTGFGEGNQQHRVNGLRWGLDNWIHAANGDSGGMIRAEKTGEVVNIGGRDLRIRPDEGLVDPQSGNAQFGRVRDDWGNWFGCANWLPVWHYALADEYLRRNPHFAPPPARVFVVAQTQVYSISRPQRRFNDFEHVNRTTSTCGLEIYRDTLLGPEYYGDVFVCEPVHNLVMRVKLEPDGATFKGRRAPGEETSDFLASTDNWFRPVLARTGPDGALWVVDMYREVIEHPEYISREDQAQIDVRAGDDKGRIYRVVPVHDKARAIPKLAGASTEDLVRALKSPNGEVRDTAHRRLVERSDPASIPLLRELVTSDTPPQTKVQALCALDGVGGIDAELLLQALGDEHPAVRRHAVRIAESVSEEHAALRDRAGIIDDPDPFVRVQAIYTLGQWIDSASRDRLVAAAKRELSHYEAAALLSSLRYEHLGKSHSLLGPLLELAASRRLDHEVRDQIMPILAGWTLAQRDLVLEAFVVREIDRFDPEDRFRLFSQYLRAVARSGEKQEVTTQFTRNILLTGAKLLAEARAVASDASAPESFRAAATSVLGWQADCIDADVNLLGSLIGPNEPGPVLDAALDALLRIDHPEAREALLQAWGRSSPEVKGRIADAFLSRDNWLDALLAAIDQGAVSIKQFDAPRRQRLLNHERADVRARAEAMLAGLINPDRQAVIEQYKAAANSPGQFLRGRGIFRERCASCHKLGDMGHAVGPDLAALTDRSRQSLLVAILDPNRSVETRYCEYRVETKDFASYSGVLASESANSVTLVAPNGIENTVLRRDIESMQASTLSPMPEGLEDGLSVEDMANLLAFVQDFRVAPKRFEGNAPRLIRAEPPSGEITLPADAAEIYGDTLRYERHHQNLGYWGSSNDVAVWRLAVDPGGTFEVALTYACAPSTAGNAFVIRAGESSRTGVAVGTDSWDDYREFNAGTIEIAPGTDCISIQAAGTLKDYLFDLRRMVLRPVGK